MEAYNKWAFNNNSGKNGLKIFRKDELTVYHVQEPGIV